jgi:Ca2+/Na+ antiporter
MNIPYLKYRIALFLLVSVFVFTLFGTALPISFFARILATILISMCVVYYAFTNLPKVKGHNNG